MFTGQQQKLTHMTTEVWENEENHSKQKHTFAVKNLYEPPMQLEDKSEQKWSSREHAPFNLREILFVT